MATLQLLQIILAAFGFFSVFLGFVLGANTRDSNDYRGAYWFFAALILLAASALLGIAR